MILIITNLKTQSVRKMFNGCEKFNKCQLKKKQS